ncbi:AI-2E family transporter [Palleronia sediminis]|uniref:AI-2E family transporter n=1 Tax=Palleronia sediminis TaxID=2547833 RepID=A0A4R6A371_9RHOB|nr:AI-2E family transporter [Palleronia sediminis]TDL78071.1 AI-2E family transporter [Palleronia sediminis]
MKDAPFLNLVLALVFLVLMGWLLVIGKPILLPIVTAIISVYVMTSASEALGRLPVLRHFPSVWLRLLVLAAFVVIVLVFAYVVAATVRDIAGVAPVYQANLSRLLQNVAVMFDIEEQQLWNEIRSLTIDKISFQAILLATLGGFTSVGGMVFLVVIYAGFLLAERNTFPQKISAAFRNRESAEKAHRIVTDINRKISDYLAIKTLINMVLGAISYVVLWVFGVDFAPFWAITIALLNYIPYVGSYAGVAFPVILSLAQFASIPVTLGLAAMLTAAQMYVGNVLEPRRIGRELNLSPFVVLVALSVWGALWGIPGAILSVPLTSIVALILSSFEQTRFLAIFLAERPETMTADRAEA